MMTPIRPLSASALLLSGMCFSLLSACAGTELESELSGDVVHITLSGAAFANVHMGAQPRPFVHPLYGPKGVPMTRSYPMETREGEKQDHPHHQSLWFAHGDVNGFDFWHGKGHKERIVWNGNQTIENSTSSCRIVAGYDWIVEEDTLICNEQRELTFSGDEDLRVIDVRVTMTPGAEPLVFGDTKEGTFAMRVHPALRVSGPMATGILTNSEGVEGKAVWGKRARWIDDSGTVEGQDVGITMMDHPANPSYPTWWHARTYGLLAANPFGVHDFEGKPPGTGALTVAVGESLEFKYRVLLHGPAWDPARIEAAFQDWVRE